MKKLLIRFAWWVLRKCSDEPVCIKLGQLLRFNHHLYEIETVRQSFNLGSSGDLVIKAEEILLGEVSGK